MIEIRKVKDNKTVEELKNNFGLDISLDDEIVALFDSDKVLEIMMYSLSKEYYTIKFVSNINNDFSLLDGLMKTVIFYADLACVRYLRINKDFKHFAQIMNFTEKEDYFEFDIYNADKHSCNCGKEV